MNKYCRICWNILNWRLPSGDARLYEVSDSYVASHGFGFEEWLFNFDWLLSGYNHVDNHEYRYAFLQPISSSRHLLVGETFSILVYTLSPDRRRMGVARIDDAYIPDDEELNWVLDQTRSKGWLETMRQDLINLRISDAPLINPKPSAIASIRFLPENVVFYQPMLHFPPPNPTTATYRYQPLPWDNELLLPSNDVDTSPSGLFRDIAPDRSEEGRVRPPQPGTVLYPTACNTSESTLYILWAQYGTKPVAMENEAVDMKLIDGGHVTFYEIKMERTVKNCIRLALGQLIEYAHYPNYQRADNLVVVGDVSLNDDDSTYLKFIRYPITSPCIMLNGLGR